MSQAGIVDIESSHPQIPTMFVANVGTAVPIANTIEILGQAVAAHGVPLQTVASGNTININAQYASASESSSPANAGVASFNSLDFSVDANGYVTLLGSIASESFQVDAFTPPGTNPVDPNGSGMITITGGQVAAGTTANVIQTNSLAANTFTIQVQRSQAVGSSTIGDNGVSHFSSNYFAVDSNGFVTLSGLTSGQVFIGGSGAPAAATLTAGTGVSIVNGNNSITINATGGAITWTDITGASQTIAKNNGYFSDNAGTITFTLPASSTIGDYFRIAGIQGLFTIAQNANQKVIFGNMTTTTGAGGSISSRAANDTIEVVATNTSASSVWLVLSSVGDFTIV